MSEKEIIIERTQEEHETDEITKEETEQEKKKKSRNWTFILYPDSVGLKSDWKQAIINYGAKSIISPIHDSDKDNSGNIKKAHYHVCIFRSTPTSKNAIEEYVKENIDPKIYAVKKIYSTVSAVYDYMYHKNNPEKAQYQESDIVCLNGFDILDYTSQSRKDKINVTKEIYIYIENNDISEFAELIQSLIMNEQDEMLEYVSNHAYFIDKILTSMKYMNNKSKNRNGKK